jgi:hypothetical protein
VLFKACIVLPRPELNRDLSRQQMLLDQQARYRRAILVTPFPAQSARSVGPPAVYTTPRRLQPVEETAY